MWLDVFQRIRELEDKLELQRRHLKELEEKVSARWVPGAARWVLPMWGWLLRPVREALVQGFPCQG